MSKFFKYGGLLASLVLIAFGIGSIYTGIDGRDRVQSDLAREQIVGTPDSTIPNQLVDTGSEAQAFAKVMRKHTLEATGGKTYAQMPRYLDASGKGTNDKAAAGKAPPAAPGSNGSANGNGAANGTNGANGANGHAATESSSSSGNTPASAPGIVPPPNPA